MNDDIYYLQTTVKESANTTRLLEEKIRQLIEIIDNRNKTIVCMSSAISLHKKQFASIETDSQKETSKVLWVIPNKALSLSLTCVRIAAHLSTSRSLLTL